MNGNTSQLVWQNVKEEGIVGHQIQTESGKCAEEKSKEAAARKFRVDTRRIRQWCQQKERLKAIKKHGKARRKLLEGAGCKADDEDLEEAVFEWIIDMHSQNLHMSLRMIQAKAKAFSTEDDFWPSQGWLYQFLNHKKFSLRRKTTICQSAPNDCIPKLVSFVTHIRRLQWQHTCKFQHENIFAMDETAC